MENIQWSERDGIAAISLNRPPANALSSELMKALSKIFDEIEQNNHVRVILIHGEGRFFSAGADIKELTSMSTKAQSTRLSTYGQNLFERLEQFPKPIIAVIHGAALGGGLELAMACHFRLVADDAKLGLPELQLGLIPGFAGTQRLTRLVGAARAAEMLFTSDSITGVEAVKLGLANHAYPEIELLDHAYRMAEKIAKKSPVSLKAAIELINFAKTESYYKGVKKETELFGEVFVSKDGREGVTAFIEKRTPHFIGE